jgi:uncharacterized protein (DUF4415 family)
VSDERIVRRKANERRRGRTDWARIDARTDAENEAAIAKDPDAARYLGGEWLKQAKWVERPKKEAISIRLDADVLAWFRAQGTGYQSLINAVLRSYIAVTQATVRAAARAAGPPKSSRVAEAPQEPSPRRRRKSAG